ncbi:MAG: metallophosphoesterase, partial [Lentisphaeria bacterium]|nr:metallophosphoesterase [Lentisphaeria bacterium]
MKIVFVGDTHYCRAREGGRSGCTCATVLDHVRYTPMIESVLTPLFARVRALEPDLVICSGDIVEGGLRSNPTEETLEFHEVLALFDSLDCPYLIARGTHDAPTPFLELVVPAMERAAGASFGQAYFRHDVEDCAFFILDYQTLKEGNAQDAWLEEQLGEAAAEGRRIFVTGHAPVILWGRHFFGDPALIRRLDTLFSMYPVEA